ncbi:MAG: hypothetical protein JXA89_05815 [Anaerolineae bacterium]|nr:hypothetical protein [Anaerolineae bacterium]
MQKRTVLFELGRTVVPFLLAGAALLLFVLVAARPEIASMDAARSDVAPARAAGSLPHEWVVIVGNTGTLSIVDPTTDIVYGPFLGGQLGSEGGGLFDVAVTPNGQMALVSNFGDSAIHFVDVSDPISPSWIMSVTTPMFAEDIAISPDGDFALVTDGGFTNLIAVLDLSPITLAYTVTLPMGYANAVDIAPDGTVVVVDYFASWIQTLYPDESGYLTVTGAYSYGLTASGQISFSGSLDPALLTRAAGDAPRAAGTMGTTSAEQVAAATAETYYARPVNLGIAPDGETVLICDVSPYSQTQPLYEGDEIFYEYAIGIYRITAPGIMTFTDVVTGLPRATQSIAFSADGSKAYLPGNGGLPDDGYGHYHYNHMSVLNIDGPGLASVNRINAVDYPRLTGAQLFGVDTIAVANGKAYIGYPVLSNASNDLRVVDLSMYAVSRLDMDNPPVGVAVIPVQKIYLPLVIK